MDLQRRIPLLAAVLLLSVSSLRAQTPADASGHWEGIITAPFGEVRIEVDLAKNASGALTGTFGNPAQNLRGFPLSNVTLDGRAISFELKATNGGGTFQGILLTNAAMSGDFATSQGSVPFTLSRTGDAKMEAPPKNAAIAKEFEGTWNGTLATGGKDLKLRVRMANQADGTATGVVVVVEQGVEVPLGLTLNASVVTLSATSLGGDFFSGTLNAAKTELAGTFKQGNFAAPLTFTRAVATEARK